DRLEAHVRGVGYQQVDFLANLVGRGGLVQVTVEPCGGGDALAAFVEKHMHDAVVAHLQRTFFFGVRQEQVFGQSPVEKQTDAVDINIFQAGEFAHLNLVLFRGGN